MICRVCSAPTRTLLRLSVVDVECCRACGHQQSHLSVPESRIDYSDAYVLERHKNWLAHPNFVLYRRVADLLAEHGAGDRVVDAACGSGSLLRYLKRAGVGSAWTGLDRAAVAAGEGIDFVQGDFLDFRPRAPFDVLTSMAAIEHFEDAAAFARRAADCLRRGGLAAIMTVDADSFLYAAARGLHALGLRGPAEQLYGPHHLNHFSRRSLAAVLEDAGFTPLTQFNHYFPLKAVDLPGAGPLRAALTRAALAVLFRTGRLLRPMLQTIVCRR